MLHFSTGFRRLYALSYLYYVPVGALVTVIVGLIISFLPGKWGLHGQVIKKGVSIEEEESGEGEGEVNKLKNK
jgi:hypothetical protein